MDRMPIRDPTNLTHADVTPPSVYFNRRKFFRSAGIAGAAALLGTRFWRVVSPELNGSAASSFPNLIKSPFSTTEKPSSFEDVSHYNNFYEFGTDKSDPSKNAQKFKTSPWAVSVEGEVKTARKFSLDDLLKLAPLEERIYRHRCVERWSIVVPWIGYSLSALIKQFDLTPKAKYVAFQSFFDPQQMPEAKYGGIDFPYVEGLRIDEAMNPLTLLCFGMYGNSLPPQDGAPVRMIIPWKYGYKSIKSIVKIRFQETEPPTTWNLYSPSEYGFYSNVNPTVDHPRWSQARERRLGEIFTKPTLMFNGYGDQVASLYSGMDLKKFH
jgi:sulfoxide reductase catalytic subunit YedY